MEKIATSFCSFEGLVRKYTYVDKTDMLWRLVSDSTDRMFFLSRPRRFGKSLMLDTLKCIFEGRRELFWGLKIDRKRYDWKKDPVVMLNMAEATASSVCELKTGLIDTVDGLVKEFGLQGVSRQPNLGKYLGNFFKALAAGNVDGLVTETLYRVYAKIPPEWRIRSEADVKRHFRLFMEMLGAKVYSEEGSARGYADAIIETKTFVWVFEFKFNKSANAAVRQIRDKGYADQYKGDKRPVTLVGINFRSAKRNIDEPLFAAMK